jgi:hypothetical protein
MDKRTNKPDFGVGDAVRCIEGVDRLRDDDICTVLNIWDSPAGVWYVDVMPTQRHSLGMNGVYAYRFKRYIPTNKERVAKREEATA